MAQTSTWPSGYRTESWPTGFNSFGLTLHPPTIVQGKITSSNTISTPGSTIVAKAGAFSGLVSGSTYIFEVTSGTAKGTVQEFTSFTANAITIPVTLTLAAEDDFQIRKAPTLEELFGTTASLLQKGTSTTADVVYVANGPGTFDTYFLNSVTNTWYSASTSTATPNVPVIYLDGLFLERRGTTTIAPTFAGEVKKGPTNCVLQTGDNYISTYSPVGVTLQNFGLEDDIKIGNSPANVDTVYVPIDSVPNYSHYYFSAALLAWRNSAGGAAPANQPLPTGVIIHRTGVGPVVFDSSEPPTDQDYRLSPVGGVTVSKSGTTATATFPVQKGKTYQAQTSTDRLNWTNLGSSTVATGSTLTVTDSSATQSAKLYRVSTGAIRPGFAGTTLARTENSQHAATLPFAINFSSHLPSASTLLVCSSGYLLLGTDNEFAANLGSGTFNPLVYSRLPVIAPLFSDADTTGMDGGEITYGTGTVDGHSAFAATWRKVGYWDGHTDKRNSFQAVIIDRSGDAGNHTGDYDVEFNYDQIQWDTPDDDGTGPQPARAGISKGGFSTEEGVANFELTGTHLAGAFLDYVAGTSTVNGGGLVYRSLHASVPGRLVFQSRSGVLTQAVSLDASTAPPAGIDINHIKTTSSSYAITASASGGEGVTYQWVQLSGPSASGGSGGMAVATIASPTSLSTNINMPVPGNYVFELRATQAFGAVTADQAYIQYSP